MKHLCSVWLALCLLFVLSAPASAAEKTRDGVFIHVTRGTSDPHRLLMALSMANTMAEENDVLVYFDIEAVHVLLQDTADINFAHFPSARSQIQTLLEKKATLMACPGCLRVAGKTPEQLLPGIQLADRKAFLTFTKGRILSLDY